jgi:hypothetical protein
MKANARLVQKLNAVRFDKHTLYSAYALPCSRKSADVAAKKACTPCKRLLAPYWSYRLLALLVLLIQLLLGARRILLKIGT